MNFINRKFSVNLLLTDTDTLVYEIRTDDVHNDSYEDKNSFYFSYHPWDSNLFHLVNKTVIGKVKDEFKGEIISEFGGLKSNMYSLVRAYGKENKKRKGVNKHVVKSTRDK